MLQALVMQQEALLTQEVKASPFTVVVALPKVLAPGAAHVGTSKIRITSHMYNDGGEDIQVGAAPCTRVTLRATVAGPAVRCLQAAASWHDSWQRCWVLTAAAECACLV